MSDDLLITPGSRKLEIKDSSGNIDAKIETDASGNLLITNAGGDISIGDTSSDIFIGDGTNNVDIVFEQDGEIRGTSGVTVTLGASGSSVAMGTDLSLGGNDITNVGDLTVTGNLTITGDINSYNVTDLDVSDKTITLGVGQTEANSGDSGIIIAGSNASMLWSESNDRFTFNKGISTSGVITASGTSASSFYAAQFSRSSSGLTTPDIWGSSSTLVLGTSSSDERLALSTDGALIYGRALVRQASSDQNTSQDSASIPSTTIPEIMRFEGGYTNGQYTTEFAKVDRSGNLPLYVRQSKGTANSFSNIARFGDHGQSNGTDVFAVFGGARVGGRVTADNLTLNSISTQSSETTVLTINGSNVVGKRDLGSNAFNSTAYLPLAGGTMTGNIHMGNYNITGVNELQINDPGEGIVFKSGSSGDMVLKIIDDSSDNILQYSGTNALFDVVGTIRGDSLRIDKASESLANQPSIIATFDSTGTDGLALISVEHLTNSSAAALGAGVRFKTGDGSTGSAKKESYIFMQGAGNHALKYIADRNHQFYVDHHDNNIEGTSYSDYGTLAMEISEYAQVLTKGNIINDIGNSGSDSFIELKNTGYTGNVTSLRQNADSTRAELNSTERSILIQAGSDGGSTGAEVRLYANQSEGLRVIDGGTVEIPHTLRHIDDSNTYIKFDADRVRIVNGGTTYLDTNNGSGVLTNSTSFGGDVSGTYNAIVVADDSHNHVISNVDGLQTALNGKLGQGSFSSGYTGDMDSLTGFRLLRSTSGTNRAFSSHHNVIQIPNTSSASYEAQVAFETGGVSDGGIKFRSSSAGTFTSWYRLYHEGHKPTYSELGTMAYSNLTGTPTIPSAFNGGTITTDLTISNTSPALNLVDTNSFSDANDRFVYRAADNRVRWEWYDNSAGTTTTVLDLDSTGLLKTDDLRLNSDHHLQRSNHHSGHLEGSYNNVAANSTKTNPIYSIGSSYNPNEDTLGNFYGIGYSKNTASFMTGALDAGNNSGWGLYVAADGDARIFLNASHGIINSTGEHYVNSQRVFHDGYHPNADKWTTARTLTLSGDVSGSVSFDGSGAINMTNTAVANDSHNHAFNNLTGKTSGTGEYSTSSYLTAGRGSGGVSLTHNDGYGNANVTFNHKAGVPEQATNCGRIVVNTDGTTNATMYFELKTNTSTNAVNTPSAMELTESGMYIPNYLYHMGDTDTYLKFDSNRIRLYAGGTVKFDSNNTYLTGITTSDVTTALGFTPISSSDTSITNKLPLAGGTMTGTLTMGGNTITGSNFNISGVNALTINDPGEGIIFTGTNNVSLYAVDDSNDNIMKFDGAAKLLVANDRVLVSSERDLATNSTGTSSTDFVTVYNVNGNNLASHVRLSVTGTTGNVVVSCVADILVNHSQDIFISSMSGNYTQLDIKVTSNNNEDFAIECKRTDSQTSQATLRYSLVALSQDTTISQPNSHSYTGRTLTHRTKPGSYQSATDDAAHGYFPNLRVENKVMHDGDTDTNITFDNNRVRIFAGNTVKFDSNNTYLTSGDGNNYLTGLSFNTGNGIITASRTGLSDVTVDLDGRYAYYDHFRSLGTTAFTGGSNPNITTAQYISEMEGDGAFDSYTSAFKTSWSYAGNYNLSDAGSFGPTETAGMAHLTWTDNSSDSTRGNITVLAIAPTTGGSAGGVYVYNDQGSGYAPGWREIWTSATDGSGSGLDADKLDGQQGSHYLNYNNLTNKPTIPTNNNQLTNGAGYITSSNGAITNKLPLAGGTMTGELQINARLDVGNGSGGDHEIRIYKADNNVSDHIQFYNGTTRVGEIGCQDGSWLRINQVTSKNIYTPRYIRADGGFFVDSTSYGIDGSGKLKAASIPDNSLVSTANSTTMHQVGLAEVTNTGSSYIEFRKQTNTGEPGQIYFYTSAASTTSRILNFRMNHKDFHADGDITAYSAQTGSDIRLKKNIRDLDSCLDKTLSLRGVKFDWKDEHKANDQLGFIAQEVEEVLPEVVNDIDSLGDRHGETHKVVNYQAVVPVLVEAIKELKQEIDDLKEQLKNKEL